MEIPLQNEKLPYSYSSISLVFIAALFVFQQGCAEEIKVKLNHML